MIDNKLFHLHGWRREGDRGIDVTVAGTLGTCWLNVKDIRELGAVSRQHRLHREQHITWYL